MTLADHLRMTRRGRRMPGKWNRMARGLALRMLVACSAGLAASCSSSSSKQPPGDPGTGGGDPGGDPGGGDPGGGDPGGDPGGGDPGGGGVGTVPVPTPAVLTWHNNNFRTGAQLAEKILTPATVSKGMRIRVRRPVDKAIYSQILYVPGLDVAGGK